MQQAIGKRLRVQLLAVRGIYGGENKRYVLGIVQ
jgi:hypothetical protein